MHLALAPVVRNGRTAPVLPECLRTEDGTIHVAWADDRDWRSLCRALRVGALVRERGFRTPEGRRRNRRQLVTWLERATAEYTSAEACAILEAAGVPCRVG